MGVHSEIGRLRRVLIHRPGPEVEQMTPAAARDLLYNEIVPVEAVQHEHDQLSAVLSLVCSPIEIEDVLRSSAEREEGRRALIAALSGGDQERAAEFQKRWETASAETVARECVMGFHRRPRRLVEAVQADRFATPPLPNLYFTRDAAFVVHERAYRAAMAGPVRSAESGIAAAVLAQLSLTVDDRAAGPGGTNTPGEIAHARMRGAPARDRLRDPSAFKIEGGDVLVVDEDTIMLGLGERSSTAGLDSLIELVADGRSRPLTALVVELPSERATIHLDMVATIVDRDALLGYGPLVAGPRAARVFEVRVDPGDPDWEIKEHGDLFTALHRVGKEMDMIPCGGDVDVVREREQWFSACNSVAIAPGLILAYRNNPATLDALDARGFSVHTGQEVLADPSRVRRAENPDELVGGRRVIAVDGVELSRGGGGPRCMTMPVERDPL